MTEPAKLHVSQFFTYDHLREPLRSVSEKFSRHHDLVVVGQSATAYWEAINALAAWCAAELGVASATSIRAMWQGGVR